MQTISNQSKNGGKSNGLIHNAKDKSKTPQCQATISSGLKLSGLIIEFIKRTQRVADLNVHIPQESNITVTPLYQESFKKLGHLLRSECISNDLSDFGENRMPYCPVKVEDLIGNLTETLLKGMIKNG